MVYVTVGIMLVAAGCSKPSSPPADQSQVQGVPAEAPKGEPVSGQEASGQAPSPQQQPGGSPAQQQSAQTAQPGASRGAQSPVSQPAAVAARPAPPPPVTLEGGTELPVRTVETLSTKTAENGARFEATLRQPLKVDGYVVAPRGARAFGVVTRSDDGGRVKGKASITVKLTALELSGGRQVDISTTSVTHVAKATKTQDAAKVGVASGIGAAIGAIAGGGRGAAIGAGAGAGAGTGVVLATKGAPAVIPSESPLTFRLAAPLTVARN